MKGCVRTGLPTLVLVQGDMLRRVVFDSSFGGYVGQYAADSDVSWLHTAEFRVPFNYWKAQLEERRDIFWAIAAARRRRLRQSNDI